MNLGERIKNERRRLEYSQTDFAALGGASKGSQISWEKGLSAPNATTLAAWVAVGLDVVYVLTGESSEQKYTDMKLERDGAIKVLQKIQDLLKLDKYDEELQKAFLLACEEVKTMWNDDGGTDKAYSAVLELLNKSPLVIIDRAAFESATEILYFVLSARHIELSPPDKALAIMSIYEAMKKGDGRVSFEQVLRAIPK